MGGLLIEPLPDLGGNGIDTYSSLYVCLSKYDILDPTFIPLVSILSFLLTVTFFSSNPYFPRLSYVHGFVQ